MELVNMSTPDDFKHQLKHNLFEADPLADFEKLFPGRMDNFLAKLGWLYSSLEKVINHDQESIPDHQYYSSLLTWNCCNTICAAIELFGRGYTMEAIGLLRNVVESACVVFHLFEEPGIYADVKANTHETKNSIKVAKKLIRPVGGLYGLLSDRFSHYNYSSSIPSPTLKDGGSVSGLIIGGGFDIQRRSDYAILMSQIDFVLLILRQITEIAFNSFILEFKFWKKEHGSIQSEWSDDVIKEKEAIIKDLIGNLVDIRAKRSKRHPDGA